MQQWMEIRRRVLVDQVSESLGRFDRNDYSVPVEYAHHPVSIRGYVDRVAIGYRQRTIAVHRRSWGREQYVFEPVHYLSLLERKVGAFDQARPLTDWPLPDCFAVLRRVYRPHIRGTYLFRIDASPASSLAAEVQGPR